MSGKYGWDALTKVGDHVVVPGKTPRQVSAMAKVYALRKFGRSALVSASSVPAGTFVVLTHVDEEPAPAKQAVEAPPRKRWPKFDGGELETQGAPDPTEVDDGPAAGGDDDE